MTDLTAMNRPPPLPPDDVVDRRPQTQRERFAEVVFKSHVDNPELLRGLTTAQWTIRCVYVADRMCEALAMSPDEIATAEAARREEARLKRPQPAPSDGVPR